MSNALLILIGLAVVGVLAWLALRQPPDPRIGSEDDPYRIHGPDRSLFAPDEKEGSGDGDKRGSDDASR